MVLLPKKATASLVLALLLASPTAIAEQNRPPWTEEDIEALAMTLSGECYDGEPEDKRRVCEVVLNRVSAGFGGTIQDVLSEPNQFEGYWSQSRPVSLDDYVIAEESIKDWYSNGCRPLSPWLFFESGDGHANEFYAELK